MKLIPHLSCFVNKGQLFFNGCLISLFYWLYVSPTQDSLYLSDLGFFSFIFCGFFYYYFQSQRQEESVLKYFIFLNLGAVVYGAVLIFNFFMLNSDTSCYVGNGLFFYNVTDNIIKLVILFFYMWSLWLWFIEVLKGVCKTLELPFFLSLIFACFEVSIHCSNFFLLFVLMELITLILVISLTSFLIVTNARMIKAVAQFFILNVFISAFYLFGTGLLLFFLVSQQAFSLSYLNFFLTIDFWCNGGGQFGHILPIIKLIMVFWLSTFYFKITLAPFSLWIVQIYKELPIFFLMIIMSVYKLIYLIIFLRLFISVLGVWDNIAIFWSSLTTPLIIISFFIGCLAYRETNIKTIFAYTTVTQLGYVLGGCIVQDVDALESAILYFILYCLQLSAVFTILLLVQLKYDIANSTQFYLIQRYSRFYCIVLTIIFFSFAGIPPFSGFFLKYFLFLHMYNAGFFSMALFGLLSSFLIAIIYFHLIIQLLWNRPGLDNSVESSKKLFWIPKYTSVFNILCKLLHVILGVVIFGTVGFYFIYESTFCSTIVHAFCMRLYFY